MQDYAKYVTLADMLFRLIALTVGRRQSASVQDYAECVTLADMLFRLIG